MIVVRHFKHPVLDVRTLSNQAKGGCDTTMEPRLTHMFISDVEDSTQPIEFTDALAYSSGHATIQLKLT
jgi:hypothetical protein